MIFGNQSKGTVIAAMNMPGYDLFIDSDFTKPFEENEPLEMLYPPDHPNSGSNYVFDTPMGVDTLGTFSFEWGRGTHYFPEVSKLAVNKDYAFPYQSEIEIVFTPTLNSGMRPLTDRAITADNGVDAFFLKGSVIRGKVSGAKRFYAGPFKGFTKEIEGVCQGATSVNLMDGSDCAGYLKGSFYEHGFDPAVHNLFTYSDQPQTKINWKSSINSLFMANTPYNGLNYAWANLRDRFKRPIPYSMTDTTDKSVFAVLISPQHAIVHENANVDGITLRFDCGRYGCNKGEIQTRQIASSRIFKQMWDAIGFVNENRDAETLARFNQLKAYFNGVKVLTFTEPLNDPRPISLMDAERSEPIFYALSIGQEGRGHHGVFCPPIGSTQFDPGNPQTLLFNATQVCSSISNQAKHPLKFITRTTGISRGDIGSSVVTYYRGLPIFLGFISNASHADGNASASIVGTGIGSSKEVKFPWGASWSPYTFLNAYLSLSGQQTETIATVRMDIDTVNQYPYPEIPF